MTDWRTEASRVIRAFDEALGRPPFPVEASDDLVLKAHAVHATIETVVSTGKLKVLDGVSEVTTTLPVLCASLAEGSPNRTPCLKLYRPLLLAVGEVICFSTYPISYLLRDAERLLAPRVDSVSIRPSVNSAAASNSTAACSAVAHDAAEVDNEVTLFRFMVLTRTLTPAYMRSFLRLPALDTVSGGKKANKKAGKGNQKSQKGASFGDDHGNKAPVSSHRPGSFAEEAHGVGSRNSTVPRALLRAMIDAPLPEECRAVFELFVDNTSKFLHCVAGDGDLAERILNVYATRIVPKLKPSSLLPCLDAPLLDYYVDIVAASQHARYATLLTSPELRNVALQTWDLARLRRLGRAAVSRKIEAHDAMASLVVYVFLYLIYCSLAQDHISPATTLPSSPNAPETEACISVTETYLITAVYKASKAVLFGDGVRSACEAGAFAYAQSRAGVLLVEGGAAPPALEPLQVFGALLLTRPVAAALWQGGFGLQWDDTEDVRATAGEIATSASLLEALVVSILANISRGPPNEGQAVYSSSKQQQKSTQGGPARSKGKQRRSAGGGENSSRTDVVSCSPIGRPPEDAARNPPLPPTPLSELLSNCCICMLLIILARRGTGASGDEGCTSAHAGYPQGAYLLDCIIRAYAYLLQHQSPHLNAALWDNFSVLLTCCMWQWALAVSCGDTAALEEAYLPSMEKLLSSPRTTTVLTALTADTGSILWLSPLLLPASLSQQDSSNPARRVLSQALWGSLCRPLWMAVVHAAVSADSPGGEATAPEQTPKAVSTPLKRQLHPVCDGFLLGVLCSQWSHAVLADVAECLAAATTRRGDGASLVARLFHMCADDACSRTVAKPPVCGVTLEYVPASLFSHGLHCFLSEVKRCQEKNSCTAELAKQRECEESRQRIQEKVEGIRALAEADRIFHEAEEARRAARTDAQRHVREELERRRAAHTARLRDEAAALERKRLVALQTLQRKAEETRLEAEAARRRRFMSYKRRLESEYRVSTFLEHLQLSSARVMEVREQLRTVMDRITPDDLLEYLVSGVAKVPADMLDDADDERVDIAHTTADGDTVVGDKQAPVGELNPKRKAPEPVAHLDRPFEECHGFWADVMDGASINARTAHQDGAGSSSRPLGEVGAAQPMGKVDAPSPATDRICSFHARIAPLMDLFCYDDGDEFGRVPDRLPYLRLRTASRVWPAAKIQSLGFTDVHEAFGRMGERGLVRLYDGVVQLTLLGFRYHYPFHNPEGMLEVLLREAQEHARALAGARRSSLTHKDAGDEGSESDNDSVVDCSESLSLSEDRLLPEVEFGI
ncbi:hypothetical protein JKF63_03013 [Porcisia hertigi]|uniref:Uncharacterized protein n=1 Tax=Porcisia hertigi TaxID=2761500 RepID=A0A836L8B4_9TRYP|nr:hypothetical protein JKF63_03013 [Porcisia hertigi]